MSAVFAKFMAHKAIAIHTGLVIVGFCIGLCILSLPKGRRAHQILGWIFVLVMWLGTLASFWIKHAGTFSFIHLLSLFTLFWLARGIWATRFKAPGWLQTHVVSMGSVIIAIIIAGTGVLIRHFISPGNVILGYYVSLGTALIVIPLLIFYTKKVTNAPLG